MSEKNKKPPDNIFKNSGVTIFISNLSEDVWPFIKNISDPKAKQFEIEENAFLADRDLFSLASEQRIVLITPKNISSTFLNYFKSLFGKKEVQILVPKKHTGEISKDIINDQKIIKKIIRIANSSKKITLIPYTTSLEFLELVNLLKKKGISVYIPESPEEEDAWTVNFFGSKSGIRQLAEHSGMEESDLIMSDGFICVGIEDAAKISAKKYIKEKGVVIKTNKGHSGYGVLIFRNGDLPFNYKKTERKILEILKKDSYWDKFPIIIESLININSSVGGGFPNVEFKITKNGRVDLLYFGGMRVTKEGVFKGMEINEDVISDKVEAQITDTGFYIGEKYAQSGYRGYYDVDFVVGKNNKIYVTESNVRRTGGTHVYQVAKKLFGEKFIYRTHILSNNSYLLNKKYSFKKLINLLKPILFDKRREEGLIIISENLLKQNKLAYAIFGKTKNRAILIEKEMENLLN